MITLGSVSDGHQPGLGRGATMRSSLPGHVPGLILICLVAGLGLAWAFAGQRVSGEPADLVGRADGVLVDALRADDTDLFAQAGELYSDALAMDARHPEALRGAAIVDLGLHRFDDALTNAISATELRPNDHIALAALVDANIELGHYEDAERELDRLLSLRPGLESASRLSYLRQLRGDDEGARQAMLMARAAASGLSFETARIDALIGELELTLGDLDAAANAYERALVLDPQRLDAQVGLARISFLQGNLPGARSALADVLNIDAGDAAALTLQAEIAHELGESDVSMAAMALVAEDALAEHERGFGIDPSVPLAVSTWGDPATGLELASIVRDARPDNIRAAHAYAWALHRADRTDDALEPLAIALQFDTTDVALHEQAAEIYRAVGDATKHDDHRERAATIGR